MAGEEGPFRYAEGDLDVAWEFGPSTFSYGWITATGTHLLGFGGTDGDRGYRLLRIAGEIVDLWDGSSTALTYPVVDEGTFVPMAAEGIGDDFVVLGRLCAATEDLSNDMYQVDTCSPSTIASFLLHEDGTWDEVPLPDEVRSRQVDGVRDVWRNGSGIFMRPVDREGVPQRQDVLRFSDGAWDVALEEMPLDGWTCITATHFYRLVERVDVEGRPDDATDDVEDLTLLRYDLSDGREDEIPLPEGDLTSTNGNLGCNDAFPVLTVSTLGGLHSVFAWRDEEWMPVEGIVPGEDMGFGGGVRSHPRGVIIPMPERSSFLIDEEARVTELPPGPREAEQLLWAGDAPALVLIDDARAPEPKEEVGMPAPTEAPIPPTTTLRVLELEALSR